MPNDLERKLVDRLQKGHIEAFNSLFNYYSQRLFRFAFSMLKTREDSENIVQEVFMKVWVNRTMINSSLSFKSYLFKIAYHLIIDQLRKRLSEKEHLEYLKSYFADVQSPPEQGSDYNLLKTRVERAINELPEKRKLIFQLSREEGLTHKEIAEKLNISVKTVENQVHIALKHIKNRLGKELISTLLFISLFT